MSSSDTTPLTRLDAVNEMLRTIGQSSVLSLETADMNADSENALKTLETTLKEFLTKGWHFNIDKNITLDPDPQDGSIKLPLNALKVDSTRRSKQRDLVWRGRRLYDRVAHSFNIGAAVEVDLVVALPFEDITPAARWYVTVKASRRFAAKEIGSVASIKLTQHDEEEALIAVEAEDSENDDRTMAQASPHVARMRRGQRGAG